MREVEFGGNIAKCIVSALSCVKRDSDVLKYISVSTVEQLNGSKRVEVMATDGYRLTCLYPNVGDDILSIHSIDGVFDLTGLKIPPNMVGFSLRSISENTFKLTLSNPDFTRGKTVEYTLALMPRPSTYPSQKSLHELIKSADTEDAVNNNSGRFVSQTYVNPVRLFSYLNVFKESKNNNDLLVGLLSEASSNGVVMEHFVVGASNKEYGLVSSEEPISFKVKSDPQNLTNTFSSEGNKVFVSLNYYREAIRRAIEIHTPIAHVYSIVKIKSENRPILIETYSDYIKQVDLIMPITGVK